MRKVLSPLFVVLCLAFGLRAIGLFYGLPDIYHQDEPMMVNHALAMGAQKSLNPHYFVIPAFVMEFLLGLYGLLFFTGKVTGVYQTVQDMALNFFQDPTIFYATGRLFVGVLFGTLTVAVLWGIVKRFFSEATAFWSTFFLSVSFLHIKNGRWIYPDAALTFFLVCFFGSLLRFFNSRDARHGIRCGIFLGLAAAVKYNAVFFAFPAVLVFVLLVREGWLGILWAVLASAVTFLMFNPFVLLDRAEFWATWQRQIGAQTFTGWGYHLTYSLANGLGWPLLVLSLAGFIAWFKKDAPAAALALGFVLTHYLVCVFFGQPYDRYAVPMVPFLCLAAAFGLTAFFRAGFLQAVAALVVLALPLAASLWSGILLTRMDTRTECRRWIEQRVPQGSGIALDHPFFSPHLDQTHEQMEDKAIAEGNAAGSPRAERWELEMEALKDKRTYRVYYLTRDAAEHPTFGSAQPALGLDVAVLKQNGVEYVVANYQDANPQILAFRERLKGAAMLEAAFSPYRDAGRSWSWDRAALTADPVLLKELFSRKSMGPYLEIYRLYD